MKYISATSVTRGKTKKMKKIYNAEYDNLSYTCNHEGKEKLKEEYIEYISLNSN